MGGVGGKHATAWHTAHSSRNNPGGDSDPSYRNRIGSSHCYDDVPWVRMPRNLARPTG